MSCHVMFVVRSDPLWRGAVLVVRRSVGVGNREALLSFVGDLTHLSVLDFGVVVVPRGNDTTKRNNPPHTGVMVKSS